MKARVLTFGNVYDMMPMIREKLGDRCPDDEVLKDILMMYTETLFSRMNKAMALRYLDDARKYNPSLPTAQGMLDYNME